MFKKEFKYIVLNINDCKNYLSPDELTTLDNLHNKILSNRIKNYKPLRNFVVVQDNWQPIFDQTWKLIENYLKQPKINYYIDNNNTNWQPIFYNNNNYQFLQNGFYFHIDFLNEFYGPFPSFEICHEFYTNYKFLFTKQTKIII